MVLVQLSPLCVTIAVLDQIAVLWWYMGPILLACKQPPAVVHLAESYIRRLLFGLFPLFLFEATRRFLQVQGIARPMLYVSIVADCLHPLWNWLLIYHFDIGFEGAGL
jgi:multidrug resistance protein, MATE family